MKKNWEIKKLGDVCEFRRGLTYSKNDEVENSSNAVLRSNNIDLITNRLDLSEIKYISNKIKIDETKKVKRDSLLICTANGSKAHLGKVALIDDDYDFAFGGFMGLLIPSESVYPRFFYYALISENYKKFIKSLSDGANINNLKFQDLSKFEIPIPPLEEQKRIVKILDEKFAQLETVKTNAQNNLQNAKDLFQSEFVNIFNKANTIRMITVETVCSSIVDCPHSTPKWITNGKLCLRTTNFKPNQIDLSTKYYVSDETYNERVLRLKPQPGDIVFSREGGILGIACMIPNGIYPCLGQRMMLLRPRKETDNRFLMYYLNSPMIEKIIKSKILGAAAPHINVADVKSFPIPEFPLPEQKRIVEELDTLSEKVKALCAIYEKQIADCEELKKSLLAKAFEGNIQRHELKQAYLQKAFEGEL